MCAVRSPEVNLTRLRIFAAVAERGSFSGAADALNYTASAVSQQMTVLERELETELFARSRRGVALTAAGRLLEVRAAAILALVDATRRELREAADAEQPFRLGTFATAASAFVTSAVGDLRAQGRRLTVTQAEPFELADAVGEGRLDAAVIFEREHQELGEDYQGRVVCSTLSLRRWPLWKEPYVVLCRHDHPLANASSVSLSALDGVELVGSEFWPGLAGLSRALRDAGAWPRFDGLRASDYATVVAVVRHDGAAGLLPWSATEGLDDLAVRPLAAPLALERPVAAITRRDNELPADVLAALTERLQGLQDRLGQLAPAA